MSKVLIISSSLRYGSNSEILAREFEKGAKAKGHNVVFVSLKGKNIKYCVGCLTCQKTKKCILDDDMKSLLPLMNEADAICFASPIYYYEMSGILKTVLDRSNPLYDGDYHFKDIYLIATCADSDSSCLERFIHSIEGWSECYPRSSIKGIVRGVSLTDSNSAINAPALQKEAYDMGYSI